MKCIQCSHTEAKKSGIRNGLQRYKCNLCGCYYLGEKVEPKPSDKYIYHFDVRIKKNEFNKLNRENYCVKTTEIDSELKKSIQNALKLKKENKQLSLIPKIYYNIPNKYFADAEHYTNEFVENHYIDCMENFDLNINYFKNIDFDSFNSYLLKFIKYNKFIEVTNLNGLSEINGIYMLVLDEYKQVYIGKSESSKGIKQRIQSHWSKKKEFRKLIWGTKETSILSIDSFGPLDTTRIFYKEIPWYKSIDEIEEDLINEFNPEYRLNRVKGGINSENTKSIRNLLLTSSKQTRNLK